MSEYKKISIIIPIYNEIKTIQILLDLVRKASCLGLEKEIVLVDDCSTDGTREFLRTLSEPNLKVIYHEINQGKGGAMHTGFANASGDIVVVQDADLEYDPAEISTLIRSFLEKHADVVYGSRYLKPDPSLKFWHSFFNKTFTRIGNLLMGTSITDLMTCYKAFSRSALVSIVGKLQSKRFGFEPEVTAKVTRAGFQIVEVPVSYSPRSQKEGKHMNLKGQIESLLALIKYSIKK